MTCEIVEFLGVNRRDSDVDLKWANVARNVEDVRYGKNLLTVVPRLALI